MSWLDDNRKEGCFMQDDDGEVYCFYCAASPENHKVEECHA